MNAKRKYLATAIASVIAAGGFVVPQFAFAERLTVEEVIVTARKQDEMQQDVPMTINAFTDVMLEERGIANLDDLSTFTPGFDFSQAFGRQDFRPAIRGQSTIQGGSNAGLFVDGFYIGRGGPTLPYGALQSVEVIKGPQSALFGRSTMAGVVSYTLKKPTEEFEGSAEATVGEDGKQQLDLTLSGPITDQLGYMVAASTDSQDGQYRNHYRPEPLAQALGKTAYDEDLGGEHTDSFTGVLQFTPTDSLNLIGRVMYENSDDDPYAIALLPSSENNYKRNTPLTGFPASWGTANSGNWPGSPAGSSTSTSFNGLRAYNGSGYYKGRVDTSDLLALGGPNLETNFYQDMGTHFEALRTSFTAEYDLNDYMLVYNGSFHNYDEESRQDVTFGGTASTFPNYTAACTPPALGVCVQQPTGGDLFLSSGTPTRFGLITDDRTKSEEYSHEFRIASPDEGVFRYMTGIYLYGFETEGKTRGSNVAPALAYGDSIAFEELPDEENSAWSVFGKIDYDFSDTFTTSFELRYNEEEIKVSGVDANNSALITTLTDYNETYEAVLPRASFSWYFLDEHNFYGVVAKGNKPGDFNTVDGTPAQDVAVNEEEAWSYELGVKSTWLDDRITSNLGVFYIDWQDQQLTTTTSPAGGGAISILDNVGESEIKGFEVEINTRNTEWWDTYLGYSFTDTEIKEFRVEPSFTYNGFGTSYTANSGYKEAGIFGYELDTSNGDYIVSGTELPQVSKEQLTLSNNFHGNLVDDIDWFFRVDYSYRTPRYDQVYNLADTGYGNLVNLRLGITQESYDVEFWVKNLEDDDTPSALIRYVETMDNKFGPNRATGVTLPEKRMSGVTVRYRF